MVMTREEFANFITAPQLKYIWDCIQGGLADYENLEYYGAGARLAHTKSLRAQIRNGHIVHRAKRTVMDRPELGIRFSDKGNRPLFYINERARLSLKKLGQNLRHSNYPTRQAVAFNRQLWPADVMERETAGMVATALWPADVLLPATNVVGGYLLNDAETAFDVYIICPDGADNEWEWQLNGTDITELLGARKPEETTAASKIRKRRLTIRPGAARKQRTDESAG